MNCTVLVLNLTYNGPYSEYSKEAQATGPIFVLFFGCICSICLPFLWPLNIQWATFTASKEARAAGPNFFHR